jgi:Protein of unknown function (DUF4242)
LRTSGNRTRQPAEKAKGSFVMLQKYIVERDIPKVGTFGRDQLRDAAKTSNAALAKLSPDVQWVESYVAEDKTFCVYLAKDVGAIQRHAEISGFPATKITAIKRIIDPTTAAI